MLSLYHYALYYCVIYSKLIDRTLYYDLLVKTHLHHHSNTFNWYEKQKKRRLDFLYEILKKKSLNLNVCIYEPYSQSSHPMSIKTRILRTYLFPVQKKNIHKILNSVALYYK